MSTIKQIVYLLTILTLLLLGCSKNVDNAKVYNYNPNDYKLNYISNDNNKFYTTSLEEFEHRVKTLDSGVIVVAERIDDTSINRIIEPLPGEREPGKIYGINHVLTPIKLVEIIYKKEEVDIVEGEQYYLKEAYFFVTDETPQYLELFGKGTILTREYEPIQSSQQYLMYLLYESSDIYDYNGEITFGTLGEREAIYSLTNTSGEMLSKEAKADGMYYELWKQVMAKYSLKK